MKKPFIYLLTAGLAFSMIANTDTVSAMTDESKASVTFDAGILEIVNVSDIVFNDVAVAAGETTGESQFDASANISDLRGTNAGWTLSAALQGFTDDTNAPSLEGTEITFVSGSAESTAGSNPIVSSGVTLTAEGEPDLLVNAVEGGGIGETSVTWASEDVRLRVLKDVVTVGSHSANINWTMTDGPVDNGETDSQE